MLQNGRGEAGVQKGFSHDEERGVQNFLREFFPLCLPFSPTYNYICLQFCIFPHNSNFLTPSLVRLPNLLTQRVVIRSFTTRWQ